MTQRPINILTATCEVVKLLMFSVFQKIKGQDSFVLELKISIKIATMRNSIKKHNRLALVRGVFALPRQEKDVDIFNAL